MECMICGQECKRRSKVFAGGKKLFACRQCVLKLRTHELSYCMSCGKYHFEGKRPPEGMNNRR
jgi:ribosome-binding protein aMBF1 (putative translation factor)